MPPKLLKQTIGVINVEWEIVGLRERFLRASAEGRIRGEIRPITIPNLRIARKAMRERLLAGTISNPAILHRWSKRFRQEVENTSAQ